MIKSFEEHIKENEEEIYYICDDSRHLVCLPYTVNNLHKMAEDLGISRSWYHSSGNKKHYDIPKLRISEIKNQCIVVSSKVIVQITLGIITKIEEL